MPETGRRIGEELGIPVYCYEFAAFEEKRRNLANCRQGEYEGLAKKIASKEWKPDFGPSAWNDSVAFPEQPPWGKEFPYSLQRKPEYNLCPEGQCGCL